MAKIEEMKVEIPVSLKINHAAARAMLGLLEMYINENDMVIKETRRKDGTYSITFDERISLDVDIDEIKKLLKEPIRAKILD